MHGEISNIRKGVGRGRAQVVAACAKYRTPVVPYGTGTSLEGHIAALQGGISLDMSRMNRILEVRCPLSGASRFQMTTRCREHGRRRPGGVDMFKHDHVSAPPYLGL